MTVRKRYYRLEKYRHDPTQRRRANAFIRKTCCKWFRWAVLPQDKALEAEIFRNASVKRCAECRATFVLRSNRAKYCPECAASVHRRQKNASDRKRRWNTDK